MGRLCPVCGTYQPITRWLTVDQKPANKADDVLGSELGCGHKYGNKEFMQFQEFITKIETDTADKIMTIKDDMKAEISAAWLKIQAGKKK